MRFTIDIDTGGTFTDGFFTGDGQIRKIKVDTTPHDFTVCFSDCLEEGAKSFGLTIPQMLKDTEVVRFSSTVGSNTMITRSGPKVGLVVTRGFEDSLYGEKGHRESLFDFILSPSMVLAIEEAVDEEGRVTKEPVEEEVRAVVKQLLQDGARIIVVSLFRATVNSSNERRVREIVAGAYPSHYLGAVPLLLSSEISISASDVIRTNTAVVNAYLHRDMVRFLYKADDYLRRKGYGKPMLVVHCGGGTARVAKTIALQTWGAGPAGGLAGAAFLSRLYGIKNMVSVDTGGTSTDIGLVVNGSYNYNYQPEIEGIKVSLPIIELLSIRGGGGSLIRPNKDGSGVQVGPESAGGLPGPVAYDLGGTEPTVTDACLVLGLFNPDYYLGGRKKINAEKARQVIREKVAEPLGIGVEQAAHMIVEETISIAAEAIGEVLSKAGIEVKDCSLLAAGGGGGTLCHGIARRLGIRKVYSSTLSAVFCAFGLSTMNVVHRYESARRVDLKTGERGYLPDLDAFNETVLGLKRQALRDMRGEGFEPEKIGFSLELEIAGPAGSRLFQSPRILMGAAAEVEEICNTYIGRFNVGRDDPVEVKLFRLIASAPVQHYQFPSHDSADRDPESARKGRRAVYWEDRFVETDVYEQNLLKNGNVVLGPAIIESEDTTILVPTGRRYTVDRYLNGCLTGAQASR
jgi:N-methylhydantoinase A/acetophenone carboxylase